jgi:hypothetical protein
MNIVFWVGVVVALILVWFLACDIFRDVGDAILNLLHNAKEEMSDEDED